MIDRDIEIVKEYLLLDYAHNMSLLYHDLKSWLEETFKDQPIFFKPHQRIVFWHQDVDYYINSTFPGFTLYNLQLILKELDISNYFCAVITHTQNYHKYTELARTLLTHDDFPVKGITTAYDESLYCTTTMFPLTYHNNIQHLFVVLSRRRRPHRTYFMSRLFERELHQKGLVAYNNIPPDVEIDTEISLDQLRTDQKNCPCDFLYTVPFNRYNSNLLIKNSHNRLIMQKFLNTIQSFKNFKESTNVNSHSSTTQEPTTIIQQAFVYVGLETVAEYPEPYMSAITFKSIFQKRPFILFAPPGQLLFVKEMGFKTFDQFWSEDYDTIIDLEERTDAILNILDVLSSKSLTELQTMLEQMRSILEHNHNHLLHNFIEQEKNKFYQGLQR
jgi:hypothetical protein